MSEKSRGSDQLKMQCDEYRTLTSEELEAVAGGASYYYDSFPRGIPWPELFSQHTNPAVNPAVNAGALNQQFKTY